MECKDFIEKLQQLPNRIEREKLFHIGGTYFVKTKNIIDFLVVTYKLLPEDLRDARKKGKITQYQSFRLFETLDKIFMGKSFLNKNGIAIVKKKKVLATIENICQVLPKDENKMNALRH